MSMLTTLKQALARELNCEEITEQLKQKYIYS